MLSAFFSAVFDELDLLSSEQVDFMDKTYILEIFGEKNSSCASKKCQKSQWNVTKSTKKASVFNDERHPTIKYTEKKLRLLIKSYLSWFIMSLCLIGNKEKVPIVPPPLLVERKCRESASSDITAHPLWQVCSHSCNFSSLGVPEALPLWSLLSECLGWEDASPPSLKSGRSKQTTMLTRLCLWSEYLMSFHGCRVLFARCNTNIATLLYFLLTCTFEEGA